MVWKKRFFGFFPTYELFSCRVKLFLIIFLLLEIVLIYLLLTNSQLFFFGLLTWFSFLFGNLDLALELFIGLYLNWSFIFILALVEILDWTVLMIKILSWCLVWLQILVDCLTLILMIQTPIVIRSLILIVFLPIYLVKMFFTGLTVSTVIYFSSIKVISTFVITFQNVEVFLLFEKQFLSFLFSIPVFNPWQILGHLKPALFIDTVIVKSDIHVYLFRKYHFPVLAELVNIVFKLNHTFLYFFIFLDLMHTL